MAVAAFDAPHARFKHAQRGIRGDLGVVHGVLVIPCTNDGSELGRALTGGRRE